jgi:putative aldouronate transport system permease protein
MNTANNTTTRSKTAFQFLLEMSKHGPLYLMALPGIIFLFIFNYLPMFGTIIAFKNFNYKDGILKSPWSGIENFKFLLTSDQAGRVIFNTIFLNLMFIFIGTVISMALALLLNEVTHKGFKKVSQSIILMPYFLSWVVISVIVYSILNYEHGTLNTYLQQLGFQPVNVYTDAGIWPFMLTLIYCWKSVGLGMVIYLAVLAGINSEYYEAAMIDGAGKIKQIWHISFPMLIPTTVILTILSIGKIMNADFGMFFSIVGNNSVIYSTADVIDTFVYRSLRELGDIGMSSAVGFLQSTVGFVLVMVSNLIVRKVSKENALF